MAREGSVAPKERVNIVYKSHTGDAQEEVELPFRFLVVGDFTGREEETPIEQRTLMGVDKDNFDDVLAGQNVAADLTVPNKLTENAEEGEELSVSLKFENMKDFSPDSIVQQVPELKGLVDLRDALTMLKGPLGNMPTFRKQLQALMDDPEAQKRILDELKGLGGGDE